MKKIRFIPSVCILCFAIMFLYDCSKESNTEDLNRVNELLGSWDWMKTIDAISQESITPATEGYNSTIQFLSNDTVKYYTNKTFTNSYQYSLVYHKTDNLNPASDSTLILQIDNGSEIFFDIDKDTLILSQAHIDGPTQYYLRGKN